MLHVNCYSVFADKTIFSYTRSPTVTGNSSVAPFGKIYASATFECSPHPPTLSTAVVKLWRRNSNGTYTDVAQKTDTELSTYWDVEVTHSCGDNMFNQYHVQAILTVFYGNWAGPYSVNSSDIGLWC